VTAGQCVVKVWSRRTTEMQAVFFTRDITLDASALSRYERKGSPQTCDL
jgi:hypothetical protein